LPEGLERAILQLGDDRVETRLHDPAKHGDQRLPICQKTCFEIIYRGPMS
jgi:hypothetical protein